MRPDVPQERDEERRPVTPLRMTALRKMAKAKPRNCAGHGMPCPDKGKEPTGRRRYDGVDHSAMPMALA